MNLEFMVCECGKAHLRGARFCDRCGSQPPRKVGNERVNAPEVSEDEAADFVSGCVAIGEALTDTGGKWGVA